MLASNLTKDFETVTKTEMERRVLTRRENRSFCSNARGEDGALCIIIKKRDKSPRKTSIAY